MGTHWTGLRVGRPMHVVALERSMPIAINGPRNANPLDVITKEAQIPSAAFMFGLKVSGQHFIRCVIHSAEQS